MRRHSTIRPGIAIRLPVLAAVLACATPRPTVASPETVCVTGKVVYAGAGECLAPLLSVTDLRAATLETDAGDRLHITMDDKGAELAIVMKGHTVALRGTVEARGKEKWLTVQAHADPRMEAAHEFWRRLCCQACAVAAARVNAATPSRLRGAVPVEGRWFSAKGIVTAWTRDATDLWLATDNRLARIDLQARRVVREFDLRDGLPDSRIYRLHSDGRTLWILHRDGLAALPVAGGRIAALPGIRPRLARFAPDGTDLWLVADNGTWRLNGPGAPTLAGPPLPTGARIRRFVEGGIWLPHWERCTRHCLLGETGLGGRLVVQSYGALYAFDGTTWTSLADEGWEPAAAGSRLWFAQTGGRLVEWDPASGARTVHRPFGSAAPRCVHLAAAGRDVWIAVEFSRRGSDEDGLGGIARFDAASGTWQTWRAVAGAPLGPVDRLSPTADGAWAVALRGRTRTLSADPGMTHVMQPVFDTAALRLLRFHAAAGEWTALELAPGHVERRLICGHDGESEEAPITVRNVTDLCVGPRRIVAGTRLFPAGYYSGYWPCVNTLAVREGDAWRARFEHDPTALSLQGEQPAVLNIANSGQFLLEAAGHDNPLGLFLHDGTHWAVTEGCAAWFDETAGTWRKAFEAEYRFYWRATAALDDGTSLHIGSDRGTISRLDLRSGLFERSLALKDRSISRLARDSAGRLVALGGPAPLGRFPASLDGRQTFLDTDAAAFNGARWTAISPPPAIPEARPDWSVRLLDRRLSRDKSRGNFAWGPAPDGGEPIPRLYLQNVFFPLFLCASPDGKRLWFSTFNGLLRVDLDKPAEPADPRNRS